MIRVSHDLNAFLDCRRRRGNISRAGGKLPPIASSTIWPEAAHVSDALPSARDDGRDLLLQARRLTADLGSPNPIVYWTDLVVSVLIGYGALVVAATASASGVAILAATLSAFALYRAMVFTHELTHRRDSELPGFRIAWNVLVGIPLLLPSFLYEGVHLLHHSKSRYGTIEDPEYLPLGQRGLGSIATLLIFALLSPLLLIVRFLVIVPFAAVWPSLRALMVERFSAMAINPVFRRLPPADAAHWIALEAAGAGYIWTAVALLASGVVTARMFLTAIVVGMAISLLNQLRTLAAHRWESDGVRMGMREQLLDTVNVPPPALLPALWAPLGLRYHALHHLLPDLPYHQLAEAHRRMRVALPDEHLYHAASSPGLRAVLTRLLKFQRRGRTGAYSLPAARSSGEVPRDRSPSAGSRLYGADTYRTRA
jgi:fatty acid desaturase